MAESFWSAPFKNTRETLGLLSKPKGDVPPDHIATEATLINKRGKLSSSGGGAGRMYTQDRVEDEIYYSGPSKGADGVKVVAGSFQTMKMGERTGKGIHSIPDHTDPDQLSQLLQKTSIASLVVDASQQLDDDDDDDDDKDHHGDGVSDVDDVDPGKKRFLADEDPSVVPEGMRRHTLDPEDNLETLAVRYGVFVEDIKSANKLRTGNDELILRTSLLIPPTRRGQGAHEQKEMEDRRQLALKEFINRTKAPRPVALHYTTKYHHLVDDAVAAFEKDQRRAQRKFQKGRAIGGSSRSSKQRTSSSGKARTSARRRGGRGSSKEDRASVVHPAPSSSSSSRGGHSSSEETSLKLRKVPQRARKRLDDTDGLFDL